MDRDPPPLLSSRVGDRLNLMDAAHPEGGEGPPPRKLLRVEPCGKLLAALLDVTADELLRVLLEDGIDLVEQIVHIGVDLGLVLGLLRARRGGGLLDLLVPTCATGLGL